MSHHFLKSLIWVDNRVNGKVGRFFFKRNRQRNGRVKGDPSGIFPYTGFPLTISSRLHSRTLLSAAAASRNLSSKPDSENRK